MTARAEIGIGEAGATLSRWRLGYLVAVLAGVTVMNNVDRILLPTLIEPIKHELGLSDSQIGLLTGLVFALSYSVAGIPISLLADRLGRSRVLSACIIFWSAATALSGAATSFITMAIARFCVAVGESGSSPTCQALVAEHVPRPIRSRIMSILGASAAGGSMIGLVLAGLLGQTYGWRVAFFAMSAPGVILGLLLLHVLPPRRPRTAQGAEGQAGRPLGFFGLAKLLFRDPVFCMMCAAAVCCVLGITAMTAWKVALVMRAFSLTLANAASLLGLAVGLSGIAGNLLGGWLSASPKGVSMRRSAWLVMAGGALFVGSALAGSWVLMIGLMMLGGVFCWVYYAPVYTAVQLLTPESGRTQAAAIVSVLAGTVGVALGPTSVGFISDLGAARLGVGALRLGLVLTSAMIIVGGLAMLIAANLLERRAAAGPKEPI